VHELIGVGLLVRSLVLGVTGALHVGLGAVADQIILLAVLDVSLETLVVLGAAGLVAVIGDGEQVISFRSGDCLMLILQDSINLSKSGGAGKRLQLFMTAAGFSILSNRKEKSVRYVLITFFKVSIKSEGVWHPLFICAILSPT
jgi:hypothetical protein